MSYRKLFLLIAFAPLGLLLFVGNAQPWDGNDSPWGFMDWGNGSRVQCIFGFGDTNISFANGTVTISLKDDTKTLTCAKIPEPGDPGPAVTKSGQAKLLTPFQVTGVQDLGCSNLKGGGSQKTFEATCGRDNADVTGIIQWVEPSHPDLLNKTYEFGGAASLNTGACNNFFPTVAGTFGRNVIFINREGFNASSCEGEGNHGPTFFRGCSATNLGEPGKPPVPSACIDTVHTGGTPANAGLLQLREFGLTCRAPFNQTSCANAQGVVQAEIDCTTIDCTQIIRSSLDCGEPDNPFKVDPERIRELASGNLEVTCPRCFNGATVFSAAGELVVAGKKSDGTTFSQDIGGVCSGRPVSQ
jgi:ribosomal protein S27E